MLARNDLKPITPYLGQIVGYVRRSLARRPPSSYNCGDFLWWHALLVPPGREETSAKWFEIARVFVYWPTFVDNVRSRGKLHYPRRHAVMPGLMFLPQDMMEIERRDEILEYAHARGFIHGSSSLPARLSGREIKIIQDIEEKLNLPAERRTSLVSVGETVRFTNELYAAFWGTGVVFEVASEARIGLEVEKVIGGPTKVYVPASEIEAM
jgi:hypothetical protein